MKKLFGLLLLLSVMLAACGSEDITGPDDSGNDKFKDIESVQ